LLASHFQGFCRDLHSEGVDFLVPHVRPVSLQFFIRELLTQNLQLKRSNAQPGSIGADFGRFGIDFWGEVRRDNPRNERRKDLLEELNAWRNSIAHQDFAGGSTLQLLQARRWRVACASLAASFDRVINQHLRNLTGVSPW
jgi:hypothetical protein